MIESRLETALVYLDGVMIGDVQRWPGGWMVWDDTIETYLYPTSGDKRHFETREDAVKWLVGRHRAIKEIAELEQAIRLLDTPSNDVL